MWILEIINIVLTDIAKCILEYIVLLLQTLYLGVLVFVGKTAMRIIGKEDEYKKLVRHQNWIWKEFS